MKDKNSYWHENLRLIFICLTIWFVVSFGFGLLLVEPLNTIRIGGSTNDPAQGLGTLTISIKIAENFAIPAYPDTSGPGTYGCLRSDQDGLPCMTCDAGSRSGELCLDESDCNGNDCVINHSLCGNGFCGIDQEYPENRTVMIS